MFVLKNKQIEFSSKTNPASSNQIGTVTISIPYGRPRIVGKKGKMRRRTVKFELPLISGQGAISTRSLRSQLPKDMNNIKPAVLNSRLYRKIVQLFNAKR